MITLSTVSITSGALIISPTVQTISLYSYYGIPTVMISTVLNTVCITAEVFLRVRMGPGQVKPDDHVICDRYPYW